MPGLSGTNDGRAICDLLDRLMLALVAILQETTVACQRPLGSLAPKPERGVVLAKDCRAAPPRAAHV